MTTLKLVVTEVRTYANKAGNPITDVVFSPRFEVRDSESFFHIEDIKLSYSGPAQHAFGDECPQSVISLLMKQISDPLARGK